MLREPLPPRFQSWLEEQSIRSEDVLLSTSNDITFEGEYAERWVVVTRDAVMMLKDVNGSIVAARSFSMDTIEDARIDSRVGSGFLQVKIDGRWAEVARFSNARAIWFERIAMKIKRFKETGELVITEEDEREANRCPTCGLLLHSATDVCPRCINKHRVFGRLLSTMKPYWPWAATTFGLVLVGLGLDLIPPQLSRILMDDVFVHDPERAYRMPQWALNIIGTNPVSMLFWVVFAGMAGVQLARVLWAPRSHTTSASDCLRVSLSSR